MDVDVIHTALNAMTTEERDKFMKEGLCFRCRKPGHISKDCPEKGKSNTSSSSSSTPPVYSPKPTAFVPRKMNAKELTAHIRALTAFLDDKEKEEFLEEADKQGF